jgi:putative transposase
MPYTRLFYHVIWATKERMPLITNVNREVIYGAIRAKTAALGGIAHALNGIDDHVHLVATVPPAIALADFVGQVKGRSSREATRATGAAFAWQSEYGLLSVSESHVPAIVRYVAEQQERHASGKLDERLEASKHVEAG